MTLKRITLRDFVIVQALDLDLAPGFTALTGETGAGKSILLDALQLALGARADASVVREGAEQAEITLVFTPHATTAAWLQSQELPSAQTLTLRRTIDTQSRSRAWINGKPATATQLRQVGEQLVNIHGQHAWQNLMHADSVRGLLDAYAGIHSTELRQRYHDWRQARQQLEHAQQRQAQRQQERERLQWHIDELEKLAPQADEWEELNTQHTRLAHAQTLLEAAQHALAALNNEETGAERPLAYASHQLDAHAHLEPGFADISATLQSCLAQLDDAQHSLQRYLERADLDPERLAALDERLGLWLQLARRFKHPPQELPQLLQDWHSQLADLNAATDLPALAQAVTHALERYRSTAQAVSAQRHHAAAQLEAAITSAMQELGMQGGRFCAQVLPLAEPSAHGLDEVQFLVAAHPGATPRPIGKVASGGELSRISLALAVATSAQGSAGTLIFDEVDAGIGGAVAQTVGALMQRLGANRQVLAVTHLPQVAAFAHQHCVVRKQRRKTGTTSQVLPTNAQQREQEIARMLGGQTISPTTLAHAREMLAQAQNQAQAAPAAIGKAAL